MLRNQLIADIETLMIRVREREIVWHELNAHEKDLMTMFYLLVDVGLSNNPTTTECCGC